VAAQVAADVGLDDVRRLEPHDRRLGVQVVGEAALEVLARGLAEQGRTVGVDVDVDRAPPRRVAARVGDRVEDGLRGRRHVPLVDEAVLVARRREHRARERALDAHGRLARVRLVTEVADDLGAGTSLG
jgi:hypothetical protein